jgi:hypothetical protein
MPSPWSHAPIPYAATVENIEEDEAHSIAELIDTMRSINQTTFRDSGHGYRSVHAKSHGLLAGELTVLPDLTEPLAQGLFAQAGNYPVVMRFSTTPGDLLDDSVSTPRGVAIKLIGVPGERLPGSENGMTQDFVMVNGPAFNKPDLKSFLKAVKLLAKTTDKAQGLKKLFSATLRGVEKTLEAVGSPSPTLLSMGGQPETHILGDTFYTQAPLRYGRYMAKLALAPVSPELTALTDQPLDVNGKPNGLRDAVVAFFAERSATWELRVQLCTDLDTMPIEDASTPWPQSDSPYLPVARLVVQPQPAWNESRVRAMDDGLSFSPWHGIAAHRPLGSIMRARQSVYRVMAEQRAAQNGGVIGEPRALDEIIRTKG